jgi:hypothetical protein
MQADEPRIDGDEGEDKVIAWREEEKGGCLY